MICNTNLARGNYEELAVFNFVKVFLEHPIEVCDLGLQGCSWGSVSDLEDVSQVLIPDQMGCPNS